jgi:methyl-accepting chemotaxis protein
VTQPNAQTTPSVSAESGLSVLAAQVSERLGETAQAIDDVARSTCLLALDAAVAADRPGQLGKGLVDASREVRALAQRTYRTLADLEGMLQTVENGSR